MPNYVQPDYRIPTTPVDSSGHALGTITVQVENTKNPLNVTAAQTPYVQPGVGNPPAPVAGQLSTNSSGSIGTSSATRADGSKIF